MPPAPLLHSSQKRTLILDGRQQPLGLPWLPLGDDGLDLSYKPGLVDASSPFGHGPRPDRMRGAALKPIAALGEHDIPAALAFPHDEHIALPVPVWQHHPRAYY